MIISNRQIMNLFNVGRMVVQCGLCDHVSWHEKE